MHSELCPAYERRRSIRPVTIAPSVNLSEFRVAPVALRVVLPMRTRSGVRPALLTVVGFLGIIAATATPAAGRGSDGPPWCMSCPIFGERAGVDIVLNVLLYMPIGAGLALSRRTVGHIALIAFAIASAIETLQVSVIPGRFASISDVITNTAGALLAVAAVRHGRAVLEPTPARSRQLAVFAAALMLAVLHVTMWMQRPVPVPASMSTLWRPSPPRDGDGGAHGTSRIAYVVLDGRAHPGRMRLAPNEIARLAARERYQLELGFVPAVDDADEDPAFELRDGQGRRVLRVRQDGRHLTADVATRARAFRLRTPTVRLRRVLSSRAERARRLDTAHIAVGAAEGDLWMRARFGTSEAHAEHRAGAFAGWGLFIPQSNSPIRVRILTFVWIAALILPPVYWAVLGLPTMRRETSDRSVGRQGGGLASPPLVLAAYLVVLVGAALDVLPRVNRMKPAGLADGFAAAVAVGGGALLALRTSRRRAQRRVAVRA
jgi:hypothetical protein